MNIHLAALLALIQSVHALSANDDVTVPDLPAEVAPPTRHKIYNLKVRVKSKRANQRLTHEKTRKELGSLGYGPAQVLQLVASGDLLFNLRIGFEWQRLYGSGDSKVTVIKNIKRGIDSIDGFVEEVTGEPLCPHSVCILGRNTECIEPDLEDFRPECVSPCRRSSFCSVEARCEHRDESVKAKCLCRGADSSITFGQKCQYSLPLIAILFLSSLCVFIIVIVAASLIKLRFGTSQPIPHHSSSQCENQLDGQHWSVHQHSLTSNSINR